MSLVLHHFSVTVILLTVNSLSKDSAYIVFYFLIEMEQKSEYLIDSLRVIERTIQDGLISSIDFDDLDQVDPAKLSKSSLENLFWIKNITRNEISKSSGSNGPEPRLETEPDEVDALEDLARVISGYSTALKYVRAPLLEEAYRE